MTTPETVGDGPVVDDTDDYTGYLDPEADTPDEDEAALVDDEPEEEEATPEAEEEPEEAPEAEAGDDVLVTLDGDEKVTLKDLKAGYFRQADYTRKTTELAQERKAVEATKATLTERTSVVETALQNLSGYLQGLIPPEPPLQLAQTDPGRYQYQRALRESAIAELGQLVSIKGQVDTHKQSVSEQDQRAYMEAEGAKLVKAMPHLTDPGKRAAFDASVKAAALEFGFSEDEVAATVDHRILRLVHYARIGQRAEANRNNAARRVVETPKEGKAKPSTVPARVVQNQRALRQLSKTGSLADAMKIDFD